MKFLLLAVVLLACVFGSIEAKKCPSDWAFPVAPSDIKLAKDLPVAERKVHEKFMKQALDLVIAVNGKFGAVIVDANNTVVCGGVNMGAISRIYHGEIVAIKNCSEITGKATFQDHTIYTTGEPCPMCQSAIMWTKFKRVVFGSFISNMYCERCFNQIPIASNIINAAGYGINHYVDIIGGVLESETDKRFPVICGTNDPFVMVPMCQSNWNRSCPKRTRFFGELQPVSDSESD
ncbi:hypothetical protein CYY_008654 [Polysphondylium violaceum]|uniref:CMP/dCMP-type deaminase domain-containing protein n=1 Tax=Polysphondylium violaceum TaxID=133409 RepID=A0A8J4PMQ2_9MYCE|nr:hypothetical protein CYY_008654 [Polysphondylium violaceum]